MSKIPIDSKHSQFSNNEENYYTTRFHEFSNGNGEIKTPNFQLTGFDGGLISMPRGPNSETTEVKIC